MNNNNDNRTGTGLANGSKTSLTIFKKKNKHYLNK